MQDARRRARRHVRGVCTAVILWCFALVSVSSGAAGTGPEAPSPVRHVILVSVDGLRPDAVTRHTADELPNFYRLRNEGAFTDNARTDVDYSNTLPNHIAQLTGRPVTGSDGHRWTSNSDPAPGETLHTQKGAYVASIFDVAHDNGLRTGAYVSKSKFVLLDRSYDETNGAPDETGRDDGRDKIDTFVYESDTPELVARFVRDMETEPFGFALVHLRDPDASGHTMRWSLGKRSAYMKSIRRVDRMLGELIAMVERNPVLAGNTVIVLTSDHGGSHWSHGDADKAEHYTVPFYVWGAGVPEADLYALNAGVRQDPGRGRPAFDAPVQPIRNGSAANLALSLLGLPPVPGSTINAASAMIVRPAPAGTTGSVGREATAPRTPR